MQPVNLRLLLFSLSVSKYFISHLLSFILRYLFIYLPVSAFSLYFHSICLCISVHVTLSAPLMYLRDHMGIITVDSELSSWQHGPGWRSQDGPPQSEPDIQRGTKLSSLLSARLSCCRLFNRCCSTTCVEINAILVFAIMAPSDTHTHPSSNARSESQHAAGNCPHF